MPSLPGDTFAAGPSRRRSPPPLGSSTTNGAGTIELRDRRNDLAEGRESAFGTLAAMAVGSSNSFDLVVLGAGTGGYTAAFRAGQLGLKVALVDEHKIGGTCLHSAASPPRRCSSRPTSTSACHGAGLRHPARGRAGRRLRADRRSAAAGGRSADQGPDEPGQEEQGRVHPRARHAPGRQEDPASPSSTTDGQPDGDDRASRART